MALLLAFPFLAYPGEDWQPMFRSEGGTATASLLFCRQTGQTLGTAVFGAVANGVPASRLGGAGDLDAVTDSLDSGTAALDAVYLGAAAAFAVVLVVALLRVPVLKD